MSFRVRPETPLLYERKRLKPAHLKELVPVVLDDLHPESVFSWGEYHADVLDSHPLSWAPRVKFRFRISSAAVWTYCPVDTGHWTRPELKRGSQKKGRMTCRQIGMYTIIPIHKASERKLELGGLG